MTLINNILLIIAITFLPFLELRASIPYGILILKMHWFPVFIIAVIANIILGPLVYFFLNKVIHIFLRIKFIFLRIKFIDAIYQRYVEKTQKEIHRYVEKYGEAALAIFIGIPLPGTGVYTGALAAYLIGMDYKKLIVSTILGVLMAGAIVTAVILTGTAAFNIFIKTI